MKTKLIKIGNSRGIRLPKALIEQTGLDKNVELLVQGDDIVLRAKKHPQAGWDKAFRKAIAKHGPPAVDQDWLDAPLINDSELPEW